MSEQAVRAAFRLQAEWCEKLGSAFTAELLRLVEAALMPETPVGQMILSWPGKPDALHDSVPLRVAGALHALARRDDFPWWSACYPPHRPDAQAVARILREGEAAVLAALRFAPQTNEVARAGLLYPGLMAVARATGQPLALFELGASAGLNLNCARFGYDLGGRRCGEAASPVQLAPQWQGAPPAGAEPVIVARQGVDLSPIDVAIRAHAERLTSYVWADQRERLARIEAAIAIARQYPPALTAGDAVQWLTPALAPRTPGVTRVLMHSIALQYLPPEGQASIAAQMDLLGADATAHAPLAWLSFETSASGQAELRLRLWPGGGETVLAMADPHGRAVNWLA